MGVGTPPLRVVITLNGGGYPPPKMVVLQFIKPYRSLPATKRATLRHAMVCCVYRYLTKTTRGVVRSFSIFSCLRLTVREKRWRMWQFAQYTFCKNGGCLRKNQKMSTISRKKAQKYVPWIGYDVLVLKSLGNFRKVFEKKQRFLHNRPEFLKKHG